MENCLQSLAEAIISFGWKEILCVILSGVLSIAVGVFFHSFVKEVTQRLSMCSLWIFLLVMVLSGLTYWSATPFWHHPVEEIHLAAVIWLLLFFLVGWFEPMQTREED